ncbi:hypothetical protein ACROYT_G038832 [Oculina patagonica]
MYNADRWNFCVDWSSVSVVTLVAIAIERYYAVMYPLGNKGKLTKRKLKVIIPGSWALALILNSPLFLFKDIEKKEDGLFCLSIWPERWMEKAYGVTWFLVVALPLSLMVGLYSRIVYALWFKRNEDNQLNHQKTGVVKVRKRVTLMVVAVTAIFGICWCTASVVFLLQNAASYNIGPIPFAISNKMVLFNSAVNPFVYALLNQQFREKMKGMFCCNSNAPSMVHPTVKLRNIGLVENNTPQTHTVEQCSTE